MEVQPNLSQDKLTEIEVNLFYPERRRVVDASNYWRILEANALALREREFRAWQDSGYRDREAFERFMAMFCAANEAGMQARRVGA